jgi:hypothetical protein
MATDRAQNARNAADPEFERYRTAVEDALQQLDWCIGYLHGIRKTRISRAIARNRNHIRTTLLDRSEGAASFEPDHRDLNSRL